MKRINAITSVIENVSVILLWLGNVNMLFLLIQFLLRPLEIGQVENTSAARIVVRLRQLVSGQANTTYKRPQTPSVKQRPSLNPWKHDKYQLLLKLFVISASPFDRNYRVNNLLSIHPPLTTRAA